MSATAVALAHRRLKRKRDGCPLRETTGPKPLDATKIGSKPLSRPSAATPCATELGRSPSVPVLLEIADDVAQGTVALADALPHEVVELIVREDLPVDAVMRAATTGSRPERGKNKCRA